MKTLLLVYIFGVCTGLILAFVPTPFDTVLYPLFEWLRWV